MDMQEKEPDVQNPILKLNHSALVAINRMTMVILQIRKIREDLIGSERNEQEKSNEVLSSPKPECFFDEFEINEKMLLKVSSDLTLELEKLSCLIPQKN